MPLKYEIQFCVHNNSLENRAFKLKAPTLGELGNIEDG